MKNVGIVKHCDQCKRPISQTEQYITIFATWHNYGGYGSGVEGHETRCKDCGKSDIETFKRVMKKRGIPQP